MPVTMETQFSLTLGGVKGRRGNTGNMVVDTFVLTWIKRCGLLISDSSDTLTFTLTPSIKKQLRRFIPGAPRGGDR